MIMAYLNGNDIPRLFGLDVLLVKVRLSHARPVVAATTLAHRLLGWCVASLPTSQLAQRGPWCMWARAVQPWLPRGCMVRRH